MSVAALEQKPLPSITTVPAEAVLEPLGQGRQRGHWDMTVAPLQATGRACRTLVVVVAWDQREATATPMGLVVPAATVWQRWA